MSPLRFSFASLIIAFGTLAGLSARALAEPARGALTWAAPPGCSSTEEVKRRIGERTTTEDSLPSEVRVRAIETEGGVRVEMSTDGAERTFVAPSCDAAATAVAVIVALAAHARAANTERTAPPEDGGPAPPPSPAEHPPVILPSPAGFRWSSSFGTAIDTGSLPQLSPGITVGIQARRGIGAVAVKAYGFFPQTERAEGDPPVQATIALADVHALGCALLPLGRAMPAAEVGACLGAGVGLLHGRSGRIDEPRTNVGFRPEGVALSQIELTLSTSIRLRLEGGVLTDPIRSPFQVSGLGDVYRPPALAARLALAIDVRFK